MSVSLKIPVNYYRKEKRKFKTIVQASMSPQSKSKQL